ncbi:MAG TPA: hypothetical protein VHF06_07970 [Pseudonocardiaceae bacterium]|jgi:hypothetical protein|nr:hypothetical protein [Pseudonocardiaceae bacterium]
MSDLEDELAAVLTEQAGTVTATPDPLHEHGRRMRERTAATRLTLSVAGVVAVAAGLVIVLPGQHKAAQPAKPPVLVTTTTTAKAPPPDPSWRIGDFTAHGVHWIAYAVIRPSDPGMPNDALGCLETVGVPAGQPVDSPHQYPNGEGCGGLQPWGKDPLLGQASVLPSTDTDHGPLPDVAVWATTSNVAAIDLVLADGRHDHATLLGSTPGVKVWITTHGVAFAPSIDYKDAHGHVLQHDSFALPGK